MKRKREKKAFNVMTEKTRIYSRCVLGNKKNEAGRAEETAKDEKEEEEEFGWERRWKDIIIII